jgi:hypothetical protein
MLDSGHAVGSWSEHYVTSQNVAGSIPDVFGFSNSPKLSSRTVALESTKPLTEVYPTDIPSGKRRPARKVNLTAVCEPNCLKNVGASTSFNHMGFHGLFQGQLS